MVPERSGFHRDDRMAQERLLEVDVFLPDGSMAPAVAEVAWCDRLPEGHPAAYDVGFRILKAWRGGTMEIDRVLA